MHEDVQFSGNIYAHLKFMVYGRKQTYTRVLQCSPASVGLAQARPNKPLVVPLLQCTLILALLMSKI